jgi:hypothetical protein
MGASRNTAAEHPGLFYKHFVGIAPIETISPRGSQSKTFERPVSYDYPTDPFDPRRSA